MPLRLVFTLELIALRGGPEWFTEVDAEVSNRWSKKLKLGKLNADIVQSSKRCTRWQKYRSKQRCTMSEVHM